MSTLRLATLVLLGSALPAPGPGLPAPAADGCVVARVVDGDTLHCRDGRRVRLIGIDSPERGQGESAGLARNALIRLLPAGGAVRLELDLVGTDRYGRVLAYVWVGRSLLNERLVREGWAVLYTVPPNVKYADRIARAQKEARARRAGLWGTGGFNCLPKAYRRGACVSPP